MFGGPVSAFYALNVFFFLAAIGLGAAFVVTSISAHFFKWRVSNCVVAGASGTGLILEFFVDLEADIGWREFTVSYVDPGSQEFGCFDDIEQGGKYSLGDYQDNSAVLAGYGMVAAWALAILVAVFTVLSMSEARNSLRKKMVSLVTLTKLCAVFSIGIITATTVFWWMVEGKFGKRQEALAPRLFDLVIAAAEKCNDGTNDVRPCRDASWDMETPGWALILGITAMFAYPAATFMLWLVAEGVDAFNASGEERELDPAKPPVGGDFVAEKATPQPEEKARAKDRRSAKTGVRAGARAPTSTVAGEPVGNPDPMTYALQEGGMDEMESQEDDEEVVYKNHQVHHNVINHSNPNRTQAPEEQVVGRQQQQYARGYSRGTSGGGSQLAGREQSFDERSEADFSETASSAQYYANNQGRSFMSMSASSQGGSFDEYR